MKKNIWTIMLLAAVLFSCNNSTDEKTENKQSATKEKTVASPLLYSYPDVIPLDSANKMIGSYLASVNYPVNTTDMQSIVINAHLLRQYLDSIDGSGDIVYLKLMFAHTLSYINSGHVNQYAGYKIGAFTVVLAGCNAAGDYVYYPTNLAIDNSLTCPTNCPPGVAANPLFPLLTGHR